jgi:hypothetical protein
LNCKRDRMRESAIKELIKKKERKKKGKRGRSEKKD